MTKAKQKKAEKERMEATGLPPSPVDDLTDHSMSASDIAKQVDPDGSGATVNAASVDKLNKEDEAKEDRERLEEDKSITGKIRKSGLHFVRDHSTGEDYVGISPAADPKASTASKHRSAVTPLDSVSPRTGMQVRTKDGGFTIPDGYGPEKTPADWAAVINPTTKKPLFA